MTPTSPHPNQSPLRRAIANKQRNELPAFFTQRMMQRIREEAQRRERRQERLLMASIIAASLGLIALVVAIFWYYAIQFPSLDVERMVENNTQPILFWSVIAAGVLVMLCIDLKLRQRWYKE